MWALRARRLNVGSSGQLDAEPTGFDDISIACSSRLRLDRHVPTISGTYEELAPRAVSPVGQPVRSQLACFFGAAEHVRPDDL